MNPITLSGMNIQLRLQAPFDIVLTAGIGETAGGSFSTASIAEVMDMLTGVAEREQLKGEIASLKAMLRRNKEMLRSGTFERQVAELRRQRAEYDAGISERWVASSRRGDSKLTGAQKTAMEKFEEQIKQALKAKQDVENGIPLTEWQIDCLYARIAGQAEPPMPEAVLAAMSQIEMPEDVGFTAPIAA